MKQIFIFFLSIFFIECQSQTIEQKLLIEGDKILEIIKQKKYKKINNGIGQKLSENDLHYLNYLSNFLDTMKIGNKLVGRVIKLSNPLFEVSYFYKKNITNEENKLASFIFVSNGNDEHYQIDFNVTPLRSENWIEDLKITDSMTNELYMNLEIMLKEDTSKNKLK